MKLSKERVDHLAETLLARLQEEEFVKVEANHKSVAEALSRAITEELLVEDRINDEVRELMKAYETEIEKGRVDYQKMFSMIKKKLIQDRGLIL